MNMPWTGSSEWPIISDYLDFMEVQGGAGAAATVVGLVALYFFAGGVYLTVLHIVAEFTDKENTE